MKNLICVFAAALLICGSAFAQDAKDLPAKVKAAFEKKFPAAQKVKWGKENATEWEAEFTMNNTTYSANFNAEGNWLETEYAIGEKDIPAAITKTLAKEFPGYKISVSEISETIKGKIYEFDLKSGVNKKEVAVNADGTMVKKDAREKEEEEKEDKH